MYFSPPLASAIISVAFLKETLRATDIIGGALTITGTYVLVTFAPHNSTHITALLVRYYVMSMYFIIYLVGILTCRLCWPTAQIQDHQFVEVILFCFLLYLYKMKGCKHVVVVLLLVALLASLTVISVKAVSGMITESMKGNLQLVYPIFYVMLVIMVVSCAFQIKPMKMFDATEVVPINFVFFTTSAIIAGIVFYQEFEGLAALNICMFLLGCLLSFLGVFLITRNRTQIKPQDRTFITVDKIPGRRYTETVQPDAAAPSAYGALAAKLMCSRAGPPDDG
ncbi:NIPA-like protein 2 [Merluccius polli]|uniref:NIPA-like protein 2 n=1 Tax=Merluccius polli TaxID=89951 RepID=A0AA47MFK5_MERPO|nr:NIPA-like protein 2 [Merluccius polli]